MSNPYDPGTTSHDLYQEGLNIESKSVGVRQEIAAIHLQTVAIYKVGAGLIKALGAINSSIGRRG